MDIPKEIIRPGTYTYINPDTLKPEKMTVTSDTIRHFADQGNKMLAAELSVPVPMEHQDGAKPLTKSERAASNLVNNAGWVKKYEVKNDRLIGILDIQDEKIIDKLPKTIRFTSPHINSFTDGDGKKWEGVISHVALTTRPRITKQEPFAHDMAAALSLVSGLTENQFTPPPATSKGISLSRAGLLKKEGDTFKPAFPLAFSLLAGVKLSEEEMKEVEKKEEEDEEEFDKEEGEEGKGEGKKSPIDEARDGKKDAGADVRIHHVIGHLLEVLGFSPPDNMDETTFERDIYETLMAKFIEVGANTEGEEEEDTSLIDAAKDKKQNDNPIVEEKPQMYASLEEISKLTDPTERKFASMMFSMHQENKKQLAAIKAEAESKSKKADSIELSMINNHSSIRERRVERLCKRMSAADRDVLLAMIKSPSAKLSLSDDGKVTDPLDTWLTLLEKNTKLPDLLTIPASELSLEPQPEIGKMSEERRKEIVESYPSVQRNKKAS